MAKTYFCGAVQNRHSIMIQPAVYRALYLGLSFLSQLLLANLLAPSGLGVLSLMILNAAFVLLLTGMGVDAIVLNSLVQKKWDWQFGFSVQVWTTLFQLGIFLVAEAGSILLLNRSLLAGVAPQKAGLEILYFSGLIFTERTLALYYSQHQAKAYNRILFCSALIYLVFLFVLYQRHAGLRLEDFLLVAGLQSLVQGFVLALVILAKFPGKRVFSVPLAVLRKVLVTASVVVITNIVQLLAYRVDYWLLDYFHTGFEVGIYAQASKIANLLWVVPNILAMLLIPRFQEMCEQAISATLRLGFLLNLVVAIMASLLAWVLYRFWLLPSYEPGLHAFWLMLPGYFCWASAIYFGAYFSWRGKYSINLLLSALCLVVVLAADLLLIPALGSNGAAIANTLAYCVVFALYWGLFCRTSEQPVSGLVRLRGSDWRELKKMRL